MNSFLMLEQVVHTCNGCDFKSLNMFY